jgi:hypothetical protein
VDRPGSVLDQVYILPPNAIMEADPEVLVGKFDDIPAAARDIQIISYTLGYLWYGGASK